MKQQIASAFGLRQPPAKVTDITVNSTLRDDAHHFAGLDWTRVTANDWRDYSDAFTGFSPEAFVYFLPSLLVLSLDRSNGPLVAADSLVSTLDTSGDPELWPDWLRERFGLLTTAELEAVRAWSTLYLADAEKGEGSEFARVQNTVAMLALNAEA